ncbi:MAG: hypothetical protein ABH816_01000 [Candidatus Levyibacteriota bacterium]
MKILTRLEKSKDFWFLLVNFFVFFLLRLPSLFEPYWYGDEGIYQTIGIAIQSGKLLYRDIWDNKPPLLYILYGIFSSDQFIIRLVSLIFGFLSVVIFFYLAKRIFENNNKATFISTSLFSLIFALPLIEGNIANAENFMLLPILASALLIFKLKDSNIHLKKIIIHNSCLPAGKAYFLILFSSGFLLSLAFLFKIVAIFDAAAFFLFIFFLNYSSFKEIKKLAIKIIPFILGFIIPIFVVALFFLMNGAFFDFLKASFVQNVGYVGYGNQFLFPQGLLVTKLLILSGFIFFLFKKRGEFSKSTLFILIWFSLSLFNAFFSQRPYSHYLLVLLPSLCLMLGLFYFEKKYQKFVIAIIAVSLILIAKNFTVYGKTLNYYPNFISFVFDKKSTLSYQSFFDRNTPIDYKLSEYINGRTKKDDKIFIWGNNAQVYKMTNKIPIGRYTVAYHMTSSQKTLEETKEIFNKTRPKYVIITSWRNPIPFGLNGYIQKINIDSASVYERAF